MNLRKLLSDPAHELEIELGQIDEKRKRAAINNDTKTLQALTKRKVELPELIRQAKIRDIAKQINDQRTRLGVYEMDLQEAQRLSQTLGTELTPKITALNQEIEKLRSEFEESLTSVEALRYQVGQETKEFSRLKRQKETLLLSEFDFED